MQGTHLVESKVDLICLSLRNAVVEACPNLRCHRSAGEQVKDAEDAEGGELIRRRFLKDHTNSEASEIAEAESVSDETSLI